MRRLIILAAAAALALSCSTGMSEQQYVDWLYEGMPLPDSLTYDDAYWHANVAKTLEVRERMGWNVPEREFRHFVMPLRVNNETLDDFRTLYADTLCARVKGMTLAEAAIEINHWCHEQATYRPSDARTSSPTATMRNGVGRCGEESVLAVAALRAAGIPARQVYTPRWAHTDDNHAWVEVYVDGKWWFMGACEPEPKLNMAWFNAPVSRAMLLHTRVFGNYSGDEDVIASSPVQTEINVIRGYVPARRTGITVTDADDSPVEGATVEFKIYNYAEFYTVASYLTDASGNASLNTGCGDIFVWAFKGDRFGYAVASGEQTRVVLSHRFGDVFSDDVDIVPPVENPIPSGATPEEIADNDRRLAEEDEIRASHSHDNPAVEAFLKRRLVGAETLLSFLSDKDRCDVSLDVLTDALENAAGLDRYLLSPRVANEFLLPVRAEILSSGLGDRLHSPSEMISWVRDSIRIDDTRNPQNLAIPPRSVWRARLSDSRSRDIFLVALFRTLGVPARIDEVTGKTQYREDGKWIDVSFDGNAAAQTASPQGSLALSYSGNPAVKSPMYYRHFTLARISDGSAHLLEFGTDADETPLGSFGKGISLDVGNYLLTSGTRMADGSVLAHLEFFSVGEGQSVETPLVLRSSETDLAVLGSMDAEQKFLPDGAAVEQSILSATGRGYFLIAVMGDKDEPTSHARSEMESVAGDINAWGRPCVILGPTRPAGLENAVFGSDPGSKVLEMLCKGCQSERTTLPVIAVCDSFGRIVCFSQGYNTSLGSDLRSVISRL